MDTVTNYREKLKEVFARHEELDNRFPNTEVKSYFLIDEARDTYALLRFGWTKKGRVRAVTIFARIDEGKIWIEEDWTEDGIATELLELGVPKEDIVLAFHPPEMRQYTEFAAA